MKIGDHELNETDSIEANRIISEFLNQPSSIIGGDRSYGNGRSFQEDKQYRLNIDNTRYIGLKLEYDKGFRHENEFLVRDIRMKIGLPNSTIKRINGFPMDGQKWREGECLLSDWDVIGQRIDLQNLTPAMVSQDKVVFLEELGKNSALSYTLGIWDRSANNFVWDKTNKKIISIDHEALTDNEIDVSITASLSNIMMKFFGPNWYTDKDSRLTFESGFNSIWAEIVKQRNDIVIIYDNYTIGKKHLFLQRISKSSAVPLSLIMMQ
jgi:hypothetical protein